MIKEFIQSQIVGPRLKQNGILVVYDPEQRYREMCLELASKTLRVIDASQNSIISREEAMDTLQELGVARSALEGMLIYVPVKAPLTDEEKQVDPFSIYTVFKDESGQQSLFPDPTNSGDEYINLCLKAKPDYATEIRRIFRDDPNPSFAVIDAVGSGTGWPNLQTLLKVESARDILFALLAPSDAQKNALKNQDAWVSEAKELFSTSLGMRLKTRGKTWSPIADELWRFVLFSEFVFDLPEPLPDSLANVPRAIDAARPLMEDLCDRLRNDRRTQALYIDKAEAIERDLDLPGHCSALKDFGVRDTFPFEERWFLLQATDAIRRDDPDAVREILERHAHSVWTGKGESQAQWGLIRSAAHLCETCDDVERQLPDYSRNLDTLIDFYLNSLREVDRLHREFEQAVGDCLDPQTSMGEVVEQVRSRYRQVAARVQDIFIRHVERSGWPPAGRLANANMFDTLIAPKLQESGRRVACFLVDALRYELGVALEKQLSEDGLVELRVACAQLPGVTPVGMASLLPDAGHALTLQQEGNSLIPVLGGSKLNNVNQRMDVLRQRYGSRFADMTLGDVIRSRKTIPQSVDLLVIRSREIDAQMETDPEAALRQISDTLKRIRAAIYTLKNKGFHDIVIATDHGFFLNIQAEAGDLCARPTGNWITLHERFLLGNGNGDAANFVLPAEQLGIRGDFAQAAGPRGLVPYRAGVLYFHGGVSLQECLVPVLTIRSGEERAERQKPKLVLSYKHGATRITTRLPVVDVEWESPQMGLFSEGMDIEFLLEAHDSQGNVVGEAKAGEPVNPATRTVTLKPGKRIQVALRMQLEFVGKFTVKALNPTTLAAYCQLDLETDYVV